MKKILFIFIGLFFQVASLDFTLKELTYTNYKNVIQSNEYTLILFYEPACEKCKKWEITLNEVALLLPEYLTGNFADYRNDFEKITFSKIDSYKFKAIAEEYEVETFPTLLFIRDRFRVKSEYDKVNMTHTNLLAYLKRKLKRVVSQISTIEELTTASSENNINVIFCGFNNTLFNNTNMNDIGTSDNKELEYLKTTLATYDNYNLYFTNNSTVETKLKCDNKKQVVLLKKNDQKVVNFDLRLEGLDEFIQRNVKPLVSDFSINIIKNIIDTKAICFVYLYKNDINLNVYPLYHNQATLNIGEDGIIFSKSDINSKESKFLIELFNIADNNLPTVVALKYKNNEFEKYKITNKISDVGMKSFITNIIEPKGKTVEGKFILSENDDKSNPEIYKITGNNFTNLLKEKFLLFTYQDHLNSQVNYIFT
jgi:thiol-disulfide isomerase/thioredoxin